MEVMKSRETFSKYIYDLHELVNKMLNKKSNLSYCDVKLVMNISVLDAQTIKINLENRKN